MATAATTTSRRRRPLQTCAASISGIIDTAYEKTGSLGNFTKHLTAFATSTLPFASTMQNLGQTMISLTDDHILFLEQVTETVFPPAGRMFDKIDELVYSVIQDLPDSPKKAESSSEEKFMFISSRSEFAKSGNFDEALSGQSSTVSSNKFVESAEQEKIDEIQGQPMVLVGSHKFAESTKLDEEALGQVSGNEFVESLDDENLDHEALGGQTMVVSDHQEPPLSRKETFVSAQYEYITSSSAADGDSLLDEFEHVELPISTTDEDENYKDNFIYVSKPLQVGSEDHNHVAAIASSSSKKKARKKKAIGKDKKNKESKGKDEHKILELLEPKWHMM